METFKRVIRIIRTSVRWFWATGPEIEDLVGDHGFREDLRSSLQVVEENLSFRIMFSEVYGALREVRNSLREYGVSTGRTCL